MMQYTNRPFSVILLSAVTLCIFSGCATQPEAVKPLHFQCDRGTNFSVVFVEKGVTTTRGGRGSIPRYEIKNVAATVTLADGTQLDLPAQKAASGFMYSNGQYTLRGKGNEATWAVGRMLAEYCVLKPD